MNKPNNKQFSYWSNFYLNYSNKPNPSKSYSYFTRKHILTIFLLFYTLITFTQSYDSVYYYYQKFDFQKTIDLIESIDPEFQNIDLINLKGKAYKNLNKYTEAIKCYEFLYHQDSANIETIIELADAYQERGNYANVQNLCYKGLLLYADNIYIMQQLAKAYFLDEKYEQAKEYFLKAYLIDSTYYLTKQLAKCYDNLDSVDQAIYYYEKAIVLNPFDFQSSYNLATIYRGEQSYILGIEVAESYLKLDSLNNKMFRLNGYLYFLDGDYGNAINQFEKCISLKDTSHFINKHLGYSYLKNKEYYKAKSYLEKAHFADTLDIDLCYALGKACDFAGYHNLAVKYLNKTILLLTPSAEILSTVYQDIALAFTKEDKYNDALNAYLTAYENVPTDTLLIYRIASHYDNWIKDKELAINYYQKFIETRPNTSSSNKNTKGVVVSYYDVAERRIRALKEEKFWEGN